MSALEKFLQDPVAFLNNHVLLPPHEAQRGINTFTIFQSPELIDLRARRGDGKLGQVYALAPSRAAPQEPKFVAYWCPYAEGQIHSVVLGRQANFAFTAKLTGCSLGIGSASADGGRLFSHANAALEGAKVHKGTGSVIDAAIAQQQAQLQLIAQHHQDQSQRVDVLTPALYRLNPKSMEEDMEATVVGVRDSKNNNWKFYLQRYSPTGEAPVYYELAGAILALES